MHYAISATHRFHAVFSDAMPRFTSDDALQSKNAYLPCNYDFAEELYVGEFILAITLRRLKAATLSTFYTASLF